MSTFAAILHFDECPVSREELQRISQAIAVPHNRGTGFKWSPTCGMVHHLNPFTPEDLYERQPYSAGEDRYWLLADARLDNREELLETFDISPAESVELPDGKLILLAFCRWGEEAPQRLIGDYAFVVWDFREKRLFAACDPMGSRTLLFHWSPSFLAISTSLRGLHALARIPRTLDRSALIDYLALRPLASGQTLFEGIERVPVGYCLMATAQRRELRRFWFLDGKRKIRLSNDDQYRQAFMELFGKAVRSRLRALGPVGISMSGGLDSSSVGALAALELAKTNQRLTAFTLVHRRSFDPGVRPELLDPEYGRVEAMKAMYKNLDVVYLTGKEDSLMSELHNDFERAGVPPHSVLFQRRHRTLFPEVQARGIRVLLNGYNGNTTMSYSGNEYPFPLLVRGHLIRAVQGVRALQPLSRFPLRLLLVRHLIRPFYPEGFDYWIQKIFPHRRTNIAQTFGIRPDCLPAKGSAFEVHVLGYLKNLMLRADPNHARRRMMIDGINNNIVDLWTVTRANLEIEERDPTQDQRLVEFCLALPMDQFLRKGANRFLIRNAMKGLLPEKILNRAFFLPREPDMAERVAEVQAEMLHRVQRVKAANRLDFLDYAQLEAMLAKPEEEMRKQNCEAARYAMRAVVMGEFAEWLEGSND